MKISKAGIFDQRVVRIEPTETLRDAADRGLHVDDKGASLKKYPRYFEPGPEL